VTCEEFERLLDRTDLSGEEEALLKAHIDSCPSCAVLYELRQAGRDTSVPPSLSALWTGRVEKSAGKGTSLLPRLAPVLAAAAVMAAAIGLNQRPAQEASKSVLQQAVVGTPAPTEAALTTSLMKSAPRATASAMPDTVSNFFSVAADEAPELAGEDAFYESSSALYMEEAEEAAPLSPAAAGAALSEARLACTEPDPAFDALMALLRAEDIPFSTPEEGRTVLRATLTVPLPQGFSAWADRFSVDPDSLPRTSGEWLLTITKQ